MKKLSVDLFSDVVCPWCFIGADRLERLAKELRGDVELAVVYRPFLLDPSTPSEGVDLEEMLREKYGREPRAMFAVVEKAAREEGLELDLGRQRRMFPTLRAHTLLRHAIALGTQRVLAMDLYRANFVEGADMADPAALAAIAARHGFEPERAKELVTDDSELAATRAEAREATELGIRGVPFFVLGERLALSGAQPSAVLRRAITDALARGLATDAA